MAKDNRSAKTAYSEVTVIASGDGTPSALMNIRDEETISPSSLKIEYSEAATINTRVEIHDGDSGASSAELSNKIEEVFLTPGERVVLDGMTYADVEKDLMAFADGTQDADVVITAGAIPVTG